VSDLWRQAERILAKEFEKATTRKESDREGHPENLSDRGHGDPRQGGGENLHHDVAGHGVQSMSVNYSPGTTASKAIKYYISPHYYYPNWYLPYWYPWHPGPMVVPPCGHCPTCGQVVATCPTCGKKLEEQHEVVPTESGSGL
jgi:hypothetical protein